MNTKCISMVIVSSWLEQYICHRGEGVVLKLERKTHTLTNKQMSPNVWTPNIQTGNLHDGKTFQKFHTKCGISESFFFPPCERCKYYMQPCLVDWGYAWVSLMFCLEPDWEWPNCTASKQLEGYFAVWEQSLAAKGVSAIYGRMQWAKRQECESPVLLGVRGAWAARER